MRQKVGLVISSSIPSASAMPFVIVVFPAARVPCRAITSPFWSNEPIFFPNSIVINYTVEDNICSMGKYTLQDSLVFMMFYCDETNFYFKTHPFDTIQYVAVIEGDTLLLREMGYWSDGKYKLSSYTIPENYIFKRKYSVY